MDGLGREARTIALTATLGDEFNIKLTPRQFLGKRPSWEKMTAGSTRGHHDQALQASSSRSAVWWVSIRRAILTDRGLRRISPRARPSVSAIDMSDEPP